ncbi:hypothetical protein KFE25_002852 [Diacronema lutheri]|uniref:Uncharacterized protein n=2 Tax=Diacronema lutheri TaxID=2081491 RepID=A0A8J6CD73_DIALT|nr:hypothetical protein KFE25_002852 [Diacronema lutheri]
MRAARGSDVTLPAESEAGDDVRVAERDEAAEHVSEPPDDDSASIVEDAISTAFTCANWALQVVVAITLSESAVLGAGRYTWVSAFVVAPLVANVCAIICWLLYSPAKGFLRKLEREPDAQVLVLLLGTISTDALALLSAHDEDRAIVRTLGLLSNFLADIPFFAIELHLVLAGFSTPVLVASLALNFVSIGVKLTRNWIIALLSYNRWRRFGRVRALSRGIAQNFHMEDALSLPCSLAFWLFALVFTAAISTRPLLTAQLAPALDKLPRGEWERELVRCYYGAVAAFFLNATANGTLWTAYLANPRFSHEWLLKSPLLSAAIATVGLVDGCALNAFTQNAMWHARVLANGMLVRLLAFDFPILVIAWRVHVTLRSDACDADVRCAAFARAQAQPFVASLPAVAMICVWWKVYRLLVCHVTRGTHGGDDGLEWRDAQLQPLSADAAFALTIGDDDGDDDLDMVALAAEAAAMEEASAAPVVHGSGSAAQRARAPSPPPPRGATTPKVRANRLRLPAGARGAGSGLTQPLSSLTTSLLFGAVETPDSELEVVDEPRPPPPRARAAPSAQPSGAARRPRARSTDGAAEEARGGGARGDHAADATGADGDDAPRTARAGESARARLAGPMTASTVSSRRGSNAAMSAASSFGVGADKRGKRKGRGRARRGKERASSVPNARQAAIDELAEIDHERKRQQRLQRGRNPRSGRRRPHSDESSTQPIILFHVWLAFARGCGGSRWLGQMPMAALCIANLALRMLFVAQAWRMADALPPGAGASGQAVIAQLTIGVLALSTLASAVAAGAAMRAGASAHARSAFRSTPVLSVLALTCGTFDPELAGALLEGFDALAVCAWSLVVQDAPWLVVQGIALSRYQFGAQLPITMTVHIALLVWKLLRILVLALARRSPAETTSGFFRHTRWGDLFPLALSYTQAGLAIVLGVRVLWLVRRDTTYRQRDIEVGALFTAQTDALLIRYLLATSTIIALGVISRLCVVCYFLAHRGFAHRGIYRHSMFSSAALALSLVEGSVFTALAKSPASYKVFKMATAMISLGLYDLPTTALHAAFYFGFVDFNELGVTIDGRGIEGLLRATAIVSIACVLYRVFNLVLIKATLSDGDDPFENSALVRCLGGALACCTWTPSAPKLPRARQTAKSPHTPAADDAQSDDGDFDEDERRAV